MIGIEDFKAAALRSGFNFLPDKNFTKRSHILNLQLTVLDL
ncbi:hypothetical protein RKLH11_2835 [Rhodobacteraceae bacterium KLH11]|nr:hypothetical protein RKLH11_2835 [Rhodobacteraceae bacterium KLH11]